MKKTFFFIFMCLPMLAFADFNICDESESWRVCGDVNVTDVNVPTETEISDSTTVTGGNTQTKKVTDNLKPKNNGFSSETLAMNTLYEVGWRS